MTDIDAIATELDALLGGQTLATLREEASKELNGTSYKTLRVAGGPRRFILMCLTGQHEQSKCSKLSPNTRISFGDWSTVSIFEAVCRATEAGDFAYAFDSDSSRVPPALLFIAASPHHVNALERIFTLPP